MKTHLESEETDRSFNSSSTDVAEFNIRKRDGKYYDISQDSLVDQGITRLTDEQFLYLFERFRLRFNLTSQCNIWCIFCSNEGSAYSTKSQKSVADIGVLTKLSDILIAATPVQSIEFSGGEPTIHPDFVQRRYQLIDWTRKYPQVKFSIHSNGVMLLPEVIDQIGGHFFKIGLSIHSVNFETWNKMTNLKNVFSYEQQHRKFRQLMQNIDYLADRQIGDKVFLKSVVIRGVNDGEEELSDFLDFCAQRKFHPKFFEFEPQYSEQEKYVVGRYELFGKLEKLGCQFSEDTPRDNPDVTYIPSVNFDYKAAQGTPRGLHSIFGCGDSGACRSCYINLPVFIKPTEDSRGFYIKPCSPLDTRFDLTWAIENGDKKQVLDIFKMSREYLMLTPGLGINCWNKEERYKIDFT